MTVPDTLDWLGRATGESQVMLRPKRDRRMGAVLDLLAGTRAETAQNPGVGSPIVCEASKPRNHGGLMAEDTKPTGAAWDATQWHEVQKGDTLSKIAEKHYGDASLYPTIFEANRDTLKDPNLIQVGQKLRIP